jgi:hypothetical protein
MLQFMRSATAIIAPGSWQQLYPTAAHAVACTTHTGVVREASVGLQGVEEEGKLIVLVACMSVGSVA